MSRVARWPVFHRPCQYFTANLAKAGILKISVWSRYCENKLICRNFKKNWRRISQIIMTLVVNLVREFLQRSLFAAIDAILGAIVTSHTPKCNESAKVGQIINCVLAILLVSIFPVVPTNYDTAQIWRCWQNGRYFTKRIWQHCICQPNEFKRDIKKKTGGQAKNWGAHGPPLESPLV